MANTQILDIENIKHKDRKHKLD